MPANETAFSQNWPQDQRSVRPAPLPVVRMVILHLWSSKPRREKWLACYFISFHFTSSIIVPPRFTFSFHPTQEAYISTNR